MLPESGKHVHLVGTRASLEIAFSQEELLQAQKEDKFCRRVIASLSRETTHPEIQSLRTKEGPGSRVYGGGLEL